MKKFFDKLSQICAGISSVLICIVASVMVINILLRVMLKSPIGGTMEIVQYGMLIALVLGLARTGYIGKHVRVSVLLDTFPPVVRNILDIIEMVVSAAVFALLVYFYIETIPESMASGHLTDAYRVPYWIVYVIIAVGMLIAAIMFLYRAGLTVEKMIKPKNADEVVQK